MSKFWCSWEADSPHPVVRACPFKTYSRNAEDKPGVLYALFSGVTAEQAKSRIQEFWPEAKWQGTKAKVFVSPASEEFSPLNHQPVLYENKFSGQARPGS
jgi:hypothetical protein